MLTILLAGLLAYGAPVQLGQQGRVIDATGTAVSGTHKLTLTLQDAEGASLYSEDFTDTALQSGFYSVVLGSGGGLDSAILAEPSVYVAVAIDDETLGEPQLLLSTPRAARADTAAHIDLVDLAGATTCTDPGRILYDTQLDALRVCVDGAWRTFGTATVVLSPEGRRWSDGTTSTSCLDYLEPSGNRRYQGTIGDGDYVIDPDGAGPLGEATVECDMSGGGWTVFHHNLEARFRSRGVEAALGLAHDITYDVDLAILQAVQANASSVQQYVKKECRGTVINSDGTQYTAWNYPPSTLAPLNAWPNPSTCDLNDDVWRESAGTVTTSAWLPMIRIYNGDTGDASEDSYFTVGPFRAR